jgi:hypothetical protein
VLFPPGLTIKDSSSTSTDRTANNVLPNGAVVQEMLICFEYVQTNKNVPVHVLQSHSVILNTILLEHPNHVTIYDKNNKTIDRTRVAALSSLAQLRDLCDLNTRQNDKARHVIVMAIRTAHTFAELKKTTLMETNLKANNTYMSEHKFGITEWDISSIGWFRNLHPNLMSHELIKSYLADEVKKNCPKKTTIPTYQLLNTSPWYKEEGAPNMRTKAIQISCPRSSSKALRKILFQALANNPIFILWTMRYNTATNYKNNLRAQHKYLINTWTIPLGGVNRNEMWYLQEFFLKNGLVTAVHPHRDTDTKGRWNLLIHIDNYKKGIINARDILDNYNTFIPDTTDVRATWSIACYVGNGVTPDGNSSNGEQTYASLSMASLVSVLTQEDYAMPVTTTNMAIDLTIHEVSVPLHSVSTIPTAATQLPIPKLSSLPSNHLHLLSAHLRQQHNWKSPDCKLKTKDSN